MKNQPKTMKLPWKTMETNQLTSWSKKRHVTDRGIQLTSFGPKNVTSLTGGTNWPPLVQKTSRHWQGTNWPFRCLDDSGFSPKSWRLIILAWSGSSAVSTCRATSASPCTKCSSPLKPINFATWTPFQPRCRPQRRIRPTCDCKNN